VPKQPFERGLKQILAVRAVPGQGDRGPQQVLSALSQEPFHLVPGRPAF
jgi:hypothetical protein